MRSIHPTCPTLLLLATLAAPPLCAQIGSQRIDARVQRAPAEMGRLVLRPGHLQSLQARLDSFTAALPAEEQVLWDRVLLRAASAPSAAGEVRVAPILQIGPGGGCDDTPRMDDAANRVAIIVQGGRTAGQSGIVVQGGRPAPAAGRVRVGTPAGDAPRPNPTGDGRVANGPKQDDPAPPPQSLGRRLAAFSQGLPAEERAALDWLLTRAAEGTEARPGTPGGRPGTPGGLASTPDPEGRPGRPATVPAGAVPGGRPGTPGGMAPGMGVSLRQALGIDVLAIGPKQDDPTPPPPATEWTLRY